MGDCIVQGSQGKVSTIGHGVMPQGAVLLSSECDQILRKATWKGRKLISPQGEKVYQPQLLNPTLFTCGSIRICRLEEICSFHDCLEEGGRREEKKEGR